MIDLTNIKNDSLDCPYCQNSIKPGSDLLFTGIHILRDISCEHCSKDYYVTLPIGHSRIHQIIVDKQANDHIFHHEYAWLALPLIRALKEKNHVALKVRKKILKPAKEVIILNCLDFCFGHVFWKLLNAQRHLNQDNQGLLVIIPETFLWLIPDGVHEVWLVDGPLSEFNKKIDNLDAFVKEEIKRFENVRLSQTFVHLDHTRIDLSKFIKAEKFDLQDFSKKTPTITYILREDRFWLRRKYDQFLYMACLKFNLLGVFDNYFIWKQAKLINKTAKLVREKIPEVVQIAAGLGSRGKLNGLIQDTRVIKPDVNTEKKWCEIYGNSHVVIGVHGSNMIIPTGLAAGFIEILPDYKIPHITEDITFLTTSRYTLFLGRHLRNGTSPKTLIKHLTSMIERFPYLKFKTESDQ